LKKVFVFLAFSAITSALHSQVYHTNINGSKLVEAYDREGRGLIWKGNDIIGSPFVSESWGNGTITFADGKVAEITELNFDMYINKPLFRKLNEEQVFMDPVKEIRFAGKLNGHDRAFHLRNGYGPAGNSSEKTYYEVLMEGPNFHLLKYSRKSVFEEMVNIGKTAKSFKVEEDLMLYHVAANTIIKVPKSKKDFQAETVNFSSRITTYLESHKNFSPKKESDMMELVAALNK